jgi:predicted transposase/invertase (TIGR01784 family)
MEFPLVKLIDYRDREHDLEESENPFALATLAVLRYIESRGDLDRLYDAKKELLRMLFERKYSKQRIVGLLRFFDWMIQLPDELEQQLDNDLPEITGGETMPHYITHWERRGIKRGLEEGKEEAKVETARRMLQEGLDIDMIQRITGLPEEKLRELIESKEE